MKIIIDLSDPTFGRFISNFNDESGCCCESPLVYSYGEKGKQKQVEQNTRKGRRINVIGVWESDQRMEYSMVASSVKTQTYLSFIELIDFVLLAKFFRL